MSQIISVKWPKNLLTAFLFEIMGVIPLQYSLIENTLRLLSVKIPGKFKGLRHSKGKYNENSRQRWHRICTQL